MTTLELTKWLRENSSGAYRPSAEAADLIERLEKQNERFRFALERIERHGPIMGSRDDYRQGQLDILKTISGIASLSLANS